MIYMHVVKLLHSSVTKIANAETNQDALQKLFADIAPRYAERQGGYTRIMKIGPRRGDGAPMVIIELV